jgi:hypothetical protein
VIQYQDGNNGPGNFFPSQKLTDAQKKAEFGSIEKWAISVIEYIEKSILNTNSVTGTTLENKKRLAVNLELAEQGKFDMNLVLSLLEPYMDSKEFAKNFPDVPTHYDIVSPRLNLIRGEDINRPFNFVAVDKSVDNISRLQKEKQSLILSITMQMFAEELKRQMEMQRPTPSQDSSGENPVSISLGDLPVPPVDFQGNPITNLEAVEKYISYSYSGVAEKIANDILKYLIQELNLEYEMNYNFLKYLATGSEIFFIGEEGGNPVVRIVDPLLFDCESSTETKFIEDCAWTREIRYLTAPEVYDIFWEELTDKEIKIIEGNKGSIGESYYGGYDFSFFENYAGTSNTIVRVARFEWQSLRKIGIIYNYNVETGGIDKDIVIDGELYPEDAEIKWFWVNERWEGYKIGDSIYKRLRPISNQYTSIDDIFKNQSNYVGIREPYSFLDRIIPYQYMFNVVMHKLKLNLARDKGPAFIMDIAQIPNTDGWSLDKWMGILDTMNVAFINSYNEKEGVRNTFNQFAVVDRSTANSTQHYISILNFIIQFVADITGITKQREGQVSPRETASGIERSVTQSTAITEAWFYTHNEVKRRVLNRLLDVAKKTYKTNKKILFILDDLSKKFIEISEDFKLSELGVYITNSAFDLKLLETLKQVAQIALQQKEITLKDFITASKSQSITEIEEILKAAERYNQQKQQELQRQQGEQQQQLEQMKQQQIQQQLQLQLEFQKELEIIKSNNELKLQQLKNEGSIEVAKINAEGRIYSYRMDLDADANNNNILDVVERDKLNFEREKLMVEKSLKERELHLKEMQLNKNNISKKDE